MIFKTTSNHPSLTDIIQFKSPIRTQIDFHLSHPKNSIAFEYAEEKLKMFLQRLKEKSRAWYVNAYLEYVMSWILYGVRTFPADVGFITHHSSSFIINIRIYLIL